MAIVAAREYRPDMLPAGWRAKPQVVEKVVEKPVEVVREVVREVPAARPAQYVAVFQKDEQSPAFVMSVDIEKRTVTVRQVAAERFPDKTYQLWIATAPGVSFHSAITSATAGSSGSTGLTMANRPGCARCTSTA